MRNRVVADLLFAPSVVAVQNLAAERLQARAAPIGDVMVDALAAMRARVAAAPERYLATHMRDGPFLLATAHRQGSTDDPARLAATLSAPRQVPTARRTARPSQTLGPGGQVGNLVNDRRFAGRRAATASQHDRRDGRRTRRHDRFRRPAGGGSAARGVPCTTLRSRAEWPETLQDSWNVLVSDPHDLVSAVSRPRPLGPPPRPLGDGAAAERIAARLSSRRPDGRSRHQSALPGRW